MPFQRQELLSNAQEELPMETSGMMTNSLQIMINSPHSGLLLSTFPSVHPSEIPHSTPFTLRQFFTTTQSKQRENTLEDD
uniref:Uncharacterized protein MANES_14G056200 n=1 Tax=Rhizophora mucronata TaxID=61149 RepID=A0A2P2JL76_RHIMU